MRRASKVAIARQAAAQLVVVAQEPQTHALNRLVGPKRGRETPLDRGSTTPAMPSRSAARPRSRRSGRTSGAPAGAATQHEASDDIGMRECNELREHAAERQSQYRRRPTAMHHCQ
jgi:hypothetical protein